MRNLDGAASAFAKNEERLQKLSLKPCDIVQPPGARDALSARGVGWIIANSGEEICLFSSDYPHVEGGRNPLKRFDDSLAGVSQRAASTASTAKTSST